MKYVYRSAASPGSASDEDLGFILTKTEEIILKDFPANYNQPKRTIANLLLKLSSQFVAGPWMRLALLMGRMRRVFMPNSKMTSNIFDEAVLAAESVAERIRAYVQSADSIAAGIPVVKNAAENTLPASLKDDVQLAVDRLEAVLEQLSRE